MFGVKDWELRWEYEVGGVDIESERCGMYAYGDAAGRIEDLAGLE